MQTISESNSTTFDHTMVRAAWQVVNVREGTVTPYFADAWNKRRLSVSKVRPDVWAWFPATDNGGFFPVPVTVSKVGVPTRDPYRFQKSFRHMAQNYQRPHTYVEVEVHDTGLNEHLFLYWFDPALEVCWVEYGLHQTIRTMMLYRRAGAGTPDDKECWRFRTRLSQTGYTHEQHEFTSTSWRFGATTHGIAMDAARQLHTGDVLVERYPFCLQDDPLVGESVWSNGYVWLPATYGTLADWAHPIRQAVQFLRDLGPERWPTLIHRIQDRYLEDLIHDTDLEPDMRRAVQGLHQAQYFDGQESIDQHCLWMDPTLLAIDATTRLFQLQVPLQAGSALRLFIKETLDRQQGHVVGIYRTHADAEAERAPYITFPTVGNWLRRLEHEIQQGLCGTWQHG
jgi:hypothetical protein